MLFEIKATVEELVIFGNVDAWADVAFGCHADDDFVELDGGFRIETFGLYDCDGNDVQPSFHGLTAVMARNAIKDAINLWMDRHIVELVEQAQEERSNQLQGMADDAADWRMRDARENW